MQSLIIASVIGSLIEAMIIWLLFKLKIITL
jgi:hypothetical protein